MHGKDIEMSEIKQEDDIEVEMKEPEDTNTVARDKKRKRSQSPLEYRHESPPPVSIENEPEIDDSALILSWCTLMNRNDSHSYLTV